MKLLKLLLLSEDPQFLTSNAQVILRDFCVLSKTEQLLWETRWLNYLVLNSMQQNSIQFLTEISSRGGEVLEFMPRC